MILIDDFAIVHIQQVLLLAILTLACNISLVLLKSGKLECPVSLPVVWIEVDSSALKALVRVLFDRNDG